MGRSSRKMASLGIRKVKIKKLKTSITNDQMGVVKQPLTKKFLQQGTKTPKIKLTTDHIKKTKKTQTKRSNLGTKERYNKK